MFGFLEFVLKLLLIQKVLFTCKLLAGVEFTLLCLPMAMCGTGWERACHVCGKQLLLGREVMFASLTLYNGYSRKTSHLDNMKEVV